MTAVMLWSCSVGVVALQPCGVTMDASQLCGVVGGCVVVVLLHCCVAGQWWPHRGCIIVVMVVMVRYGGYGSHVAGVLLPQLWLWLWQDGRHGWLRWGQRGGACNRRVHSNIARVVTKAWRGDVYGGRVCGDAVHMVMTAQRGGTCSR